MTDNNSQGTAPKLQSPQVLNEGQFLEGAIKWFKVEARYGFIIIDYHNGREVFLHISDVPEELRHSLAEGTRVRFKMVLWKGKTKATDLSLIEDKEVQAAA